MSRLERAAVRIAGLEPAVVVLAAPFLLFPTLRPAWTAVALAVLVGVWLAGWMGGGRLWTRTPLDGALLLFALTIPVSVWASVFPELTLPKLTGLILGLATFRATVNAVHSPRRLWAASLVFVALGLGLVVAGLVGANWHAKWPALEPILARMPRLIEGLPGAEGGIHPNELAGALVLFMPVSLALLTRERPKPLLRTGVGLWAAALLATLVMGLVVLFSQSRSAWIGAGVAMVAMAWLRWARGRSLIVGGLVVAALALLYVGPLEVLQSVFAPSDPVEANWMANAVTLEDRVELWSRAVYTIREFPFTGCGLGAFRQVVNVLYPFPGGTSGTDVAHAHNVFLQVALDLGLPGLIAYLASIGTALWIGWRVGRSPLGANASAPGEQEEFRWLGQGIVGGLVAFHVYGLTDTVALGAKPGPALWMLLGLAAALWAVTRPAAPESLEATAAEGAGAR